MNTISALTFLGFVSHVVCSAMPGAPSSVATNGAVVQKMAEFAVKEIGSEYGLVEVISATKQVVNGMIYTMELKARRVVAGEADKNRICKAQVYEIVHQNYLELEEFHCHFANKQPRL